MGKFIALFKKLSSTYINYYPTIHVSVCAIVQASEDTSIESRPICYGSRRLRLPEFRDSRHMKVVNLSALRKGRLYPPGDIPDTHFLYRVLTMAIPILCILRFTMNFSICLSSMCVTYTLVPDLGTSSVF